ncbi:MAG: DUF362 domain-containing protein [Acidobacteriaceae bacterium]|nr:DUF362 domain-containing protein [Acidobacteriaceae bacterium]MBV9295984.1 DUF362 domain-containing protein [Acidobacteriaceae bacterium]MBV9766647.1 DUF362 domain-containing protein [Acidobacteriaceae bacterium]
MSHPTRRDLLTSTGAAAIAALGIPKLLRADAPASTVAIVRCRNYADFGAKLSTGFDQIGGIESLVRGKTVALKLNLTGNPTYFPLTPDLPYRTNGETVASTVHLLAKAGARRVRIIESFFPATQDPNLWARYGLDVNAINNLGTQLDWENVQNLGKYKQYVRLKVPWGGYMYPAYYLNQAFTDCDVYASLSKLKNHWIAGVTMSMKNNFGNTPCSLYGSDCGPSGNEHPTKERGDVLHAGTTKAPSGVDPELHPDSPREAGYRVPRIVVDQVGIRPIDLAIVDGVETVRGGEGPWLDGLEKMTPGVIIVGRNPVCVDSVGMAVMSYSPQATRGISPFIRGDNTLKLAEAVGIGTADLNRIEVVGLSIKDARIDFGPGAVGKTMSQLKAST